MTERKPFDFSLFGDAQLLDLTRQAEREIARRRSAARRLVRDRGGLFEAGPPRYCNPENPSETWSGKGSRPPGVIGVGRGHLNRAFSNKPISFVFSIPFTIATRHVPH